MLVSGAPLHTHTHKVPTMRPCQWGMHLPNHHSFSSQQAVQLCQGVETEHFQLFPHPPSSHMPSQPPEALIWVVEERWRKAVPVPRQSTSSRKPGTQRTETTSFLDTLYFQGKAWGLAHRKFLVNTSWLAKYQPSPWGSPGARTW